MNKRLGGEANRLLERTGVASPPLHKVPDANHVQQLLQLLLELDGPLVLGDLQRILNSKSGRTIKFCAGSGMQDEMTRRLQQMDWTVHGGERTVI